MIDPKKLDELAGKMAGLLQKSPFADVEKNAKLLLSSFFAKLDLVSRDEFEIQAEMIKHMENRLAALEKCCENKSA